VQLAGWLVADPNLKYTPPGKTVCRMRLAHNDTKVAQFHDIVAWEGVAETAAESLRKGAAVAVEGVSRPGPGKRATARSAGRASRHGRGTAPRGARPRF
jgi:hypothetical protein